MREKTGVGEIDYRNYDEELIDIDIIELGPLGGDGDEKYILQSETMHRGASAMTLDFLCD